VQIAELKEIAPLLAGVIAAGATLIAVIVTSSFNIRVARLNIEAQGRQKSREIRIQKFEELFLLFDKWQLNLSNISLIYYRCYLGKITYKEAMELTSNNTFLAPGEAQKYRMVMELHFPSLAKEYELVDRARKNLVPFLSDPQISKLSPKDFESSQVVFESECGIFKSKISKLAHETLD